MKAVIDTCVIIDALQSREPFCSDAQTVFLLCANKHFDGLLTAKAITDIYYLMHRYTHNDKDTRCALTKLCTLFKIIDTAALDVQKAILSEVSDFEDAVMIETAIRAGAECIITRNTKDYAKSLIRVYTPTEFIALMTDDSSI